MFAIPRRRMIWLCHSLATMLDAGLPVIRALGVLASQSKAGRLGRILRRVIRRLDGGETLAEAFAAEGRFPPIFLLLVGVGEQTGSLERTVAEAGRFFEFQQRLWRTFLSGIMLPAIQYVIAVAVVSFALFIVNMLGERPTHLARDLLIGYGTPVALVGAYVFALRPLGATRPCHELLLMIPLVGGVARALAVSRFSLTMHLMSEGALPVPEALRRSLAATNNGAFAARAEAAVAVIEGGGTMTEALARTRLFPREFMEIVAVAEQSGKLSERFDWLAAHYGEVAERSLSALGAVLARLIWVIVAAIIIYFIFKLFSFYSGALGGALGG